MGDYDSLAKLTSYVSNKDNEPVPESLLTFVPLMKMLFHLWLEVPTPGRVCSKEIR